MGLGYGIEIMSEVLIMASEQTTFYVRLMKSFSELNVLKTDDLTVEHFYQLNILIKKYKNRNIKFIDENNRIVGTSDNAYEYLKEINRQVVDLANDVINTNKRILKEQEFL